MKIVFLEFVTHFGGAQRSMVEFAARLKGHAQVTILDVDGFCRPFAQAAEQLGVERRVLLSRNQAVVVGGQGRLFRRLLNVARSLPALWQARARAAQAIRELAPDLVISHHFKSASLIGFNRGLRDIRQMVYLHGWYTPDMLPWYGRKLLRDRCAGILTISRATKHAVICAGIDGAKIHVLHNPIDIDDMRRLAARPLLTPLPQMHRPVRILLPAAVIRTKGQHTAVAAMRRVLDAGVDAVLWLAGPHAWAVGANKDYPDRVRGLAARLGVAERIAWIGDREDLPQVYQACTQVVLPTHTEGHPRVIVEAMALERPVTACPVGGVVDMILPETTGLLFDVEDEAALADNIVRFAREEELVGRVTTNALHYVRTCFRPQAHLRQALRIFDAVIGGQGPRELK